MNHDHPRRASTIPFAVPAAIPNAPPLPAPRPLQRARDAATRFFGYPSRPPSPQGSPEHDRITRAGGPTRYASLSATQNATATHKTGLEINTIAINERGTHALLGGKEIFKTIKIEGGSCAEESNLRSAIRSTPTQASGKARQVYSIDIADVAWAKGDCGDYVAAATSSGKIILYDLGHAGLQAAQLHEHFRQVHKVTFNPHRGNLLLSGSQDGTVRLWDVRDVRQASTLQSKRKYSGQSDGVRDVKWSPTEGVDFAFGTDSGWIQCWDIRNLKTAKVKIPAHSFTCNTIDWHPDGKHIVSASSDKTVRVWDFSTTGRRRSHWEIKTPYPVLNARWRPACESSMPHDNGARQCTQLVTSYDRDHPVLHIWDLRRPALPFREMSPYPSAPTDLLWHSQDLLWTVGREGVFQQADIQHAPKVIMRRNLQFLALSSRGEMNFVTQKRRHFRVPKNYDSSALLSNVAQLSHSPDSNSFSRSWADDSLDHLFLSVASSKRPRRESHMSRTSSVGVGTSRPDVSHSPTVKLDDILLNRKSYQPRQGAVLGKLAMMDRVGVFTYLAREYTIDITSLPSGDDFFAAFEGALNHNAKATQAAGLYRLAQTWRIVAMATVNLLKDRVKNRQRQQVSQAGRAHMINPISLGYMAKRMLTEHSKSYTTTPASMQPISGVARHLAVHENNSSMATPLARSPLAGENIDGAGRDKLPNPDDAEKLDLPPLLASGPRADLPAQIQPGMGRRLTHANLSGLDQLQANASNGINRTDMVHRWSVQPKEPLSLDIVDSSGLKLSNLPKLEKHDSNESFVFMADAGGDSRATSFPSSFASTGSGPLQMVAERPSRRSTRPGATARNSESEDHPVRNGVLIPGLAAPTKTHDILSARPASGEVFGAELSLSDMEVASQVKSGAEMPSRYDLASYPDENGITVNFDWSNSARGKEDFHRSNVRHTPEPMEHLASTSDSGNKDEVLSIGVPVTSRVSKDVCDKKDSWSLYFPNDNDADLEEDNPFTLVGMLQELLTYYASHANAQAAVHLFLLIGPLLPRSHPLPESETWTTVSSYIECFTAAGYSADEIEGIFNGYHEHTIKAGLQPLQLEAILSTYHDELLGLRLLNEATVLRKLAFPAYPAVYEHSVKDNAVHLKCGACGTAITTGMERLVCESCRTKQACCPVCRCENSPYDTARPARLLSTCLLCNHSGHAACLHMWFLDSGAGDGGCPTEGCLCHCTAGRWRDERMMELAEHNRRLDAGGGRVKSDDWPAPESKAVERTRTVLVGVADRKSGRSEGSI